MYYSSTLTVVARCRCAARCPDASTSQLSHSDTPATNSQRPFRRRAPQQLPLPKMIDPGGSPDVAPAAAELEDLRLLPGGKPLSRSASPCPPPPRRRRRRGGLRRRERRRGSDLARAGAVAAAGWATQPPPAAGEWVLRPALPSLLPQARAGPPWEHSLRRLRGDESGMGAGSATASCSACGAPAATGVWG